MKKIFSFVFTCLLAFILIGCNADEKDNKLDDNNDNVINQGSDNSGEEKLGNNEENGSNETNNENNENKDPIEVVKEDKFVMVEEDTIFTFFDSLGNTSAFYGNPFTITYDDDDVLFYCKIDNGYLNNIFGSGERVHLKELVAKNGDKFEWVTFDIEHDNFFEAVFKKDDNIVGYAVVWCEIFCGLAGERIPVCDFKCLKSVVFLKVDGEYQNVPEEDVNELINEAKNSINKEFKFNYDNCVEINYELRFRQPAKQIDVDYTNNYWGYCIVGHVLSCTKVFNNFDDLFNSFDYLWLRKGEYIDFLDQFEGIDNLEEHKDLFELDFDKRSVIVISQTKVDEIDDIKVFVDNNRNLCVRIEGKDTNFGGWLNDRFNDKYYHIREWYFIEVDKIDGLDYTDVYADIIVTNNIN